MKIARVRDPAGHVGHAAEHADGSMTRLAGDLFGDFRDTGEPVTAAARLAPIEPAAVLCIGRNYRAHAEEMAADLPEHPVLFMKMPSAVQHPEQPIVLPRHLASQQVDYEGELAVVIGKRCKNAAPAAALDYVLGYTCANDVSARDWQKQWGGGQWCRGKTFDTFCPLGPRLVTADELPDPQRLRLETRLNGEVMQEGDTADMIFDVATLIAFLSGSSTLVPGTVILTGTPDGVGFARQPPVFLQDGDLIEIEIDAIGALRNPVVAERDAPADGIGESG